MVSITERQLSRQFSVFAPKPSAMEAYNVSFDRKAFREASPYKKNDLIAYTEKQLITHVGERLNVVLSKGRLNIKEGHLVGENTDIPLLEMMQRGRDYRRKHGKKVDFPREDAEVIGFNKIQRLLVDENTPVETMIISVSPRGREGSSYTHNFYDIFTLKEDESGRYVESRRYASALTAKESVQKLKEIVLGDEIPLPNDVSLLANPILISKGIISSAQELHLVLHKDHPCVNEEEFNRVIVFNKAYRQEYLRALVENPDDPDLKYLYNAVLKNADKLAGKDGSENNGTVVFVDLNRGITKEQIIEVGKGPVRQVMTGCGSSGAAEEDSAYSVSQFGDDSDEKGSLRFICPKCKQINRRPRGEVIPNCQKCGGDVSCNESWE